MFRRKASAEEPPRPGDAPPELLDELAEAGYPAPSVTELSKSGVRYREAVPVLCRWLPRLERPNHREAVIRALSVPWARPEAVGPLIAEFRRDDEIGERHRWTVGNALNVVMNDKVYDDVVPLATDPAYGRGRQMVVLGLGRSKRAEAVDVLLGLVDDPDVGGHAVTALAKIADPRAREALERMTGDDRDWVRKEATKGLEKIAAKAG